MTKRAPGVLITFHGSLTPTSSYYLVNDLSLKYPVYECRVILSSEKCAHSILKWGAEVTNLNSHVSLVSNMYISNSWGFIPIKVLN